MRFIGAIIAGGRGTRMGTPHKAALRLPDGSRPVDRLAQALVEAGCDSVLVVANDPAPYPGFRVIPDLRPGCGPLAGIEAALAAAAGDPVCVVAGDQPALDAATLKTMIAAWTGGVAVAWCDRMHPLCAVLGPEVRADVVASLDRGDRAVYRLWERLDATQVRFTNKAVFSDIDTPEDLARI